MKKISIIFLLFVFHFLAAQNSGLVSIRWADKSLYSYGGFNFEIPQFQSDNFNFDTSKKEISYQLKFPINIALNQNSILLTNIVFEPISESQLGAIDKTNIKSVLKPSLQNVFSRDLIFGLLSFNPIIKDETGYKKVVSLSYSYNFNASVNKNSNISSPNAIVNSVLNTGGWARFYIDKSGVYKISKSFLSQLGIDVNTTDPRKIKIYGNGGRMVPLSNSEYYPNDLEENAIRFVGEEDGIFNDGDYILFYGEGFDNWSAENETHLNLYASKSYYYVTSGGTNGKRIAPIVEPTAPPTLTLTNFDDYQYHEIDNTNIGRLGRVWFGENFSLDNDQDFTFNFPNIVSTEPTKVTVHVGGNSFVTTSFGVVANGQNIGTIALSDVGLNSFLEASNGYVNASIASTQSVNVKLTFNNNGVPTSKGYLDYIIIKAKSNLVGFNKQFRFQYNDAPLQTGIAQYQISNATNIKQIWDITDIYNVTSIDNPSQSNFSFKSNLGTIQKFIAIDEADLYTPLKESNTAVANQNLKGTIFNDLQGNFQDIDYLIITPSFLNAQAEKLATFHRTNSNINVKVVNLDKIYLEFGGGKQDIGAIRNFVKYIYENASSPANRIKYLNMFGDASFDYKDRIPNNTNIVPIFQSVDSYYKTSSSFASDDYFGMMDANEGDLESFYGSSDIAVGRMLVSSVQQAEEMVNKVIEYHDVKSYGSWRNNYVAISDDADQTGDGSLQVAQNNLTDNIYINKQFINYKKILLDSYQQQTTAGGDRYPQAKEDMTNAFEKGALVFNYLGHGGEDGLTGERLWDKLDGYNFSNQYKYPLFITITCQFSRFDNPYRPTAGEYTYWNPKGGAIAMVTTIREISYAFAFNKTLSEKLFGYGTNATISIAEALRLTKGISTDGSAIRVVSFIGDPALMLAIPKPKVVLTKVNDVPVTQVFDDFKALSYVKLTGEVQDENGLILNNYNGEISVNVFDKDYNKSTFNNDGYSPTMTFTNLGETIFRGNASISNGNFEIGFVVPKDIKIPLGNGRVSFYAKRNQIALDKTGYNLDIKVGGINANAVADVTPPKVRLYMNDETFVNGGITNESPFFLAFLEDEHGINTASGIGHDILAILDGDETKPYILNDYYETELNNYTKGKIRFPFRNLAKGLHTITFKAWDVYNNYVTAEIQFIVADSENVTLTNVLNYPNPFVNYTQFWFSHNKPYEPLEVQVQIMTITGKVVKTINKLITTEGFLSREITWDGKDDFGDAIGKGVYIYKLTVKSTVSNSKSEKIEKLVIL